MACIVIVFSVLFLASALAGKPNITDPVYLGTPETTCDDIKLIVDYHNELRRLVANGSLEGQPRAVNMQKIVWDPALAQIAENYSKQMIIDHNSDAFDPRFAVGENMFLSGSNKKNSSVEWKKALNSWFRENSAYAFTLNLEDHSETSHYTQLVWADTIYVGCGTTHLYDKATKWYYKLYVCNYGPRGNMMGQFPYVDDSEHNRILTVFLKLGLLLFPPFGNYSTCSELCCYYQQCDNPYGTDCIKNAIL